MHSYFFSLHQTLFEIICLPVCVRMCSLRRRSSILPLFFFFWSHVLQSPITEELGLLANAVTPPCQGPMRADEHTECFMRPTTLAEPELEVAGWNYLVLKLGVIKSREWPPDITAGWAARLWSTWGFWKQSQRDLWRGWCFGFFCKAVHLLLPLFRFSQWQKCIVLLDVDKQHKVEFIYSQERRRLFTAFLKSLG